MVSPVNELPSGDRWAKINGESSSTECGEEGSTDQSTSPVNPSIRPSTLTTIFTTGSGNLFSTIFVGRKVDGRIDPLFFFFLLFPGGGVGKGRRGDY